MITGGDGDLTDGDADDHRDDLNHVKADEISIERYGYQGQQTTYAEYGDVEGNELGLLHILIPDI